MSYVFNDSLNFPGHAGDILADSERGIDGSESTHHGTDGRDRLDRSLRSHLNTLLEAQFISFQRFSGSRLINVRHADFVGHSKEQIRRRVRTMSLASLPRLDCPFTKEADG